MFRDVVRFVRDCSISVPLNHSVRAYVKDVATDPADWNQKKLHRDGPLFQHFDPHVGHFHPPIFRLAQIHPKIQTPVNRVRKKCNR
jgi:hypothetical protein